jgi:hypothetical protein
VKVRFLLRHPCPLVRACFVATMVSGLVSTAPASGAERAVPAAATSRSSLEVLRASTQALAGRTAVLEATRERLETSLAEKADLDRRASLAAEKTRRAVTAKERAAREVERRRLESERDALGELLVGLEREALRDVSASKDLVRETQKVTLASREEETRERDKARRAALHEALEKASLALRRAEDVLASKTLAQLAAPRPVEPQSAPSTPQPPPPPVTSPDNPEPAPGESTPNP